MRKVFLAAGLAVLLYGCSLFEPTYLDLSQEQLEAVAAQVGTTVDQLLSNGQTQLKAILSEELGMTVERVIKENGELIAEIKPTATEAVEKTLEEPLKDPGSPQKWITGGVSGLAVLLAGVLGLRGRAKRKKEEAKA
jgi:hypothetical protein